MLYNQMRNLIFMLDTFILILPTNWISNTIWWACCPWTAGRWVTGIRFLNTSLVLTYITVLAVWISNTFGFASSYGIWIWDQSTLAATNWISWWTWGASCTRATWGGTARILWPWAWCSIFHIQSYNIIMCLFQSYIWLVLNFFNIS